MVPMAAGGAAAAVALVALLAALAVCRRRTRVRARRRAMMQSSHGQLRVWVNRPMAKRCIPCVAPRPPLQPRNTYAACVHQGGRRRRAAQPVSGIPHNDGLSSSMEAGCCRGRDVTRERRERRRGKRRGG